MTSFITRCQFLRALKPIISTFCKLKIITRLYNCTKVLTKLKVERQQCEMKRITGFRG